MPASVCFRAIADLGCARHVLAMPDYVMLVEQSVDEHLPPSLRVDLRPFRLSKPSGLEVFEIENESPDIGDQVHVFSSRIVNGQGSSPEGMGGYLYRLRRGRQPDQLESYKSIAKVWVSPTA